MMALNKRINNLSSALRKNLYRRKISQQVLYRTAKNKLEVQHDLAIGLMSGTSLDGVDAALIDSDGDKNFYPLANLHLAYPLEFQQQLKLLLQANPIEWLILEQQLTKYHIEAVLQLLEIAQIERGKISVIGFHGQTIYHNPNEGITCQIGNPHLLVKECCINVVSDFRRRDIAHGGQGAPLVPIFHRCIMQDEQHPVAVLNIGGIANITYIDGDELLAFDTGPGNGLINDMMIQYFNKPYDDKGLTASSGEIHYSIITQILQSSFFERTPPKSLDRNHFNDYLQLVSQLKPADVIATLTQLTVETIKLGLKLLPRMPYKIYLCGGGTHNLTIIQTLQSEISSEVVNINSKGLDPNFIEAQAFAYLSLRLMRRLTSTFPNTTGTSQETSSGVLYPVL